MKFTKNISDQIQNYLQSEKKPLICIVWPTATWKTDFAIEIAKNFNWEIINCDSRQIFKEVECITGLDYEELKWTKNHFFWIAEVDDKTWTSAKFLEEVEKLIWEIYSRKNIPVLVWWTWLFFSSLIEWFEIPKNSANPEIVKWFKNKTNEELFEELQKLDFEYSEKTHPNNRNRVERALEFFYSTWEKKSSERKNSEKKLNPLIFSKKIFSDEERNFLYEKINFRQKKLFENSLEKISELLKKFFYDEKIIWKNFDFCSEECLRDSEFHSKKIKNFSNYPAFQSIWIPEINSFLKWEILKEEAIKKTQQSARNYAKRQMTWWRKKDWVTFI